ncbi:hypothetical protein L195_g045754, partial [Trifolium pratense]
VLTQDLSRIDGSRVYTGLHEEQLQVEDNTVPNPVSDMKSTDNDSSFLSDGNAVLTTTLQVFDQMPVKPLNSTSVNQQHSTISSPIPLTVQLPKGISISSCNFLVGSVISSQQQLLEFDLKHSSTEKFQLLLSNTICIPAQFVYLSFSNLQCFDPGGSIPPWVWSATVPYPPPKPPDNVAFWTPSLHLFTTTEHIAVIQYSYLHLFPISLTVLQLFDEMPMSQVVICKVITSRCAYRRLEVVKFELSKKCNIVHIVPPNYTYTLLIMRIFTYEEDIWTTQLYSITKEVDVGVDDWSKAYEDVTLAYHFLLNNHF